MAHQGRWVCHCEALQFGVHEKPLLFGERTNGDTRSRHTYRICLPSTADEDDVAIPQRGVIHFLKKHNNTEIRRIPSFIETKKGGSALLLFSIV